MKRCCHCHRYHPPRHSKAARIFLLGIVFPAMIAIAAINLYLVL